MASFSRYLVIIVVFCTACGFTDLTAQEKYWIFFRDKDKSDFDPYAYFDAKAIERRQRLNLPLFSETDLPVNKKYLNELVKISGRIYTNSRWLNAVTIKADAERLKLISRLPYVIDIKPVEKTAKGSLYRYKDREKSEAKMELLKMQTERMGGSVFEQHGIDGKGVRIAVFDGGFTGVDTSPCFEKIRREGRIIATYDFVRKHENVYAGIHHGTMVLSCIAGVYEEKRMGLATGAEYLLARTERRGELFSEEENWLAAVEWADKNGADIINSSLGYTYNRYFPVDMDGRTSLVARAAGIAAKKGILVVNAMGNDGNKSWEFLGTPADADSVMSVGGIDPGTDYHISFSSYGPTSDMRRKPNISAYAEVMASKDLKLVKVQGTSFSTPLVAGFAACVMQMYPHLDNMEIFRLVEHSAHLYPYYDYAHGYGIPQAGYFFTDSIEEREDVCFEFSGDTIFVVIPEEISLIDSSENNLLYFHLENEKGVLERYSVVLAYQHDVLKFLINGILDDKILRVHFRGTTIEHKF